LEKRAAAETGPPADDDARTGGVGRTPTAPPGREGNGSVVEGRPLRVLSERSATVGRTAVPPAAAARGAVAPATGVVRSAVAEAGREWGTVDGPEKT
jgi:hypothetical protein